MLVALRRFCRKDYTELRKCIGVIESFETILKEEIVTFWNNPTRVAMEDPSHIAERGHHWLELYQSLRQQAERYNVLFKGLCWFERKRQPEFGYFHSKLAQLRVLTAIHAMIVKERLRQYS